VQGNLLRPQASYFYAMKTSHIFLVAAFGLAMGGAVRAADSSKPVSRAVVTLDHPEKFTDAADGPRGSDFGRDSNLQTLSDYIVKRANVYLNAGQHLAVTLTDVDLAGEVEPWRDPGSNVRYVKEIYRPRIALTFKLTDDTGKVLKEGDRALSDSTFMMNINPDRSDPRVYEKRLLDDWMRREFSGTKK
jgi:hypothetical protein